MSLYAGHSTPTIAEIERQQKLIAEHDMPERVAKIRARQATLTAGSYTFPTSDIALLLDAITASEKRAEIAAEKLQMTENIARMTGDERDKLIVELEETQQELAKAENRASEAERDRDDYQKALDRALAQRDEAERTFADLRTGMQKVVAENAQFARRINELERALSLSEADIAGGHHRESKLVRERDEARRLGGISDALWCNALSERDEAVRRAEEWKRLYEARQLFVTQLTERVETAESSAALPAALELIDELRSYAREQWDYKHGKRWDAETEAIRTALTIRGMMVK